MPYPCPFFANETKDEMCVCVCVRERERERERERKKVREKERNPRNWARNSNFSSVAIYIYEYNSKNCFSGKTYISHQLIFGDNQSQTNISFTSNSRFQDQVR